MVVGPTTPPTAMAERRIGRLEWRDAAGVAGMAKRRLNGWRSGAPNGREGAMRPETKVWVDRIRPYAAS